MAGLVDAFYVAFGFDTSGLTKGEEEVERTTKRTREKMKKDADETEKAAKELTETVTKLRKQVVGLFAVFTAGAGIKSFTNDITSLDVGLGRLAALTGMGVRGLSQWRNAIRAMGGDGDAVVSGMHSLTQELQQFAATGESAVVPYLRTLGITVMNEAGQIKTAAEIYLDAAQAIQDRGMDPARAEFFLRGLGITDTALITAALKGRTELQRLLDEQAAYGPSEEDARQAEQFQKAMNQIGITSENVGRRIMVTLAPAIMAILKGIQDFMDFLNNNQDVALGFFTALTLAVGAFGVVAIGTMTGVGIATTLATGGIIAIVGVIVAATSALIRNWDSVKRYFASWVDWIRDKYNVAARFFGLPTWEKEGAAAGGGDGGGKGGGSASDLASLIARGEGDYNSVNLGQRGGYRSGTRDLENMTVGEVMAAQKRGDFNAAGRYQVIGSTLREAVKNEKISPNTRFDKTTQDKIFGYLINSKRPEIGAYISGKSNDKRAALKAAAMEWASVQDPDTGKSYYAGVANNKASISSAEMGETLDKERAKRVAPSNVARGARGSMNVSNTTRTDTKTVNNDQSVTVGAVTVNTQAKDAEGIAREIKPALERQKFAQQGNYGAW